MLRSLKHATKLENIVLFIEGFPTTCFIITVYEKHPNDDTDKTASDKINGMCRIRNNHNII